MKTIVFTAAPYCYGPTAKSICVAEELYGQCEMIFVGMEPAISLTKDSVFSRTFEIDDRDEWGEQALGALASSDLLVSALEYRALPLAAALGVPSIFIDTLYWLRDQLPPHTELAESYLAQQFFETIGDRSCRDHRAIVKIGPVLPKRFDEHRPPFLRTELRNVLVSFGGLKSPAMRPGADQEYVAFVLSILQKGLPANCGVRLALPRYFRETRAFEFRGNQWAVEYPSQRQFYNLLETSDLLITTPGLETVYEATAAGLPVIFLPPYNATQLLQSRTYLSHHIGLHQVEAQYEEIQNVRSSALNQVTCQIQALNATYAQDSILIQQLSQALASSISATLTNPDAVAKQLRRNQSFLQSLGSSGRVAAAKLIADRLLPVLKYT